VNSSIGPRWTGARCSYGLNYRSELQQCQSARTVMFVVSISETSSL